MPDITLSQYYPGGCFKQLSDAAGAAIPYSQYAPGGPANQLRTHISPALVLDQHYPGGVWGQAVVAVEGDSGSAAPEWVPANAKVHIDLAGNRAWTETDGEVAVDTLLGSDPNASGGFGPTLFDPSYLTADGYVNPLVTYHPPAIIGSAVLLLLAGSTIRYQIKALKVGTAGHPFSYVLPTFDGDDALELGLFPAGPNKVVVSTWEGSQTVVMDLINNTIGSINVVATTITDTRFEVSVNGSSVFVNEDGHPDVAAAVMDTGNQSFHAWQSLTIYDPLSGTAGLSGLSVP